MRAETERSAEAPGRLRAADDLVHREITESAGSILSGRAGLLMLFASFLISVYCGAAYLSVFILIVMLTGLISAVWSRGVIRKAELSAQTRPDHCHAGESFLLRMALRNRSFFPLIWLDVVLPLGEHEIAGRPDDSESYRYYRSGSEKALAGIRQRFTFLLPQQEICWDEKLTALKRGVISTDEIVLRAGDGFGLSAISKESHLPRPLVFYIYPKLFDIRAELLSHSAQETISRRAGSREDTTLIRSTRAYQYPDPAKRINWRLLASTGKLQVNSFETVRPGLSAFVIDLLSFRRKYRINTESGEREVWRLLSDELEEMISVTASSAEACRRRGVPTALLLPSYGSVPASLVLPGSDGGCRRLMEELASVTYKGQASVSMPSAQMDILRRTASFIFFVSETDDDPALISLAKDMGKGTSALICRRKSAGRAMDLRIIYASELCGSLNEEGGGRYDEIV